MALQFNPNIRNLYLGRGLRNGFASTFAVSVYSGTQPTAAQVTGNWSLYASTTSGFLAHFNNLTMSQPSDGTLVQFGGLGANPTTANNSGTASWAIVWATNITAGQVAGGTLPSANFIVVPCSNSTGQGVIRFVSTTITAATSVTIQDASFGAYVV